MFEDLIKRLQKCPELTCHRCTKAGTEFCAVNEAVRELKRFDHVIEILNNERDD